MPDTTVNLMWIGNRSLLDSTPTTNISTTEARAIDGWTAAGRDEIAPVALTGNYYTASGSDRFHPTYMGTSQQPASQFTYTSPSTGQQVSGATINTFITARFTITVHDENGIARDVVQNGVLLQMSNGDIFFRPSVTTLPQWTDIDRVSKIVVSNGASQTAAPATIGFTASIFDMKIVCFARGTRLQGPFGAVAVESIIPGDLIQTKDNGFKPVLWLGRVSVASLDHPANEALRPIRIGAGSLGKNLPEEDLLVSPQHRILVRSEIAQRMFGTNEVLVAAKQLLQIDGIDIANDLIEVEYFHILFDQHEIVISNGAETESLYTGPEALAALSQAAKREIVELFPELAVADYISPPARTFASGRMGRKLAVRHAQNDRALVS